MQEKILQWRDTIENRRFRHCDIIAEYENNIARIKELEYSEDNMKSIQANERGIEYCKKEIENADERIGILNHHLSLL
jgi:hypothetical protein